MVTLFLLFAWAAAYAQNPLSKKVTLRGERVFLRDALNHLLHQDGVYLMFNKFQLPDQRVDVYFEDAPLGEVLDYLLQDSNLEYKVKGTQVILTQQQLASRRRYTLSGYITDSLSGEGLVSALVQIKGSTKGVVTNPYGFFSLQVPEGKSILVVSYVGYENKEIVVEPQGDGWTIDIPLRHTNLLLTEVLVTNYTDERNLFRNPEVLPMDLLEEVPRLGGEADILRLVYAQPGVQTDVDGVGGMHVRGGGRGENLVLVDGVQVYDLQHAGGLISIFNSDAIRSATFLKGGFPARYGGRLSSVLDIRTKEGNLKEWEAGFNASMMTVGGKIEGPIIRDKMSILFSGRFALLGFYLEPLTSNLRGAQGKTGDLDYRFFDINGKISYTLSDKDRVFLSFYTGRDQYLNKNGRSDSLMVNPGSSYLFNERNEEGYRWGNQIGVLRWNRVISPNLFTNTSISYSQLNAEGFFQDADSLVNLNNGNPVDYHFSQRFFLSSIKDFSVRSEWDWTLMPDHQVRFGAGYTHHTFQPGIRLQDEESISLEQPVSLLSAPTSIGHEWWVFAEDDWDISDRLWLNLGLRYSGWGNQGTTFHVVEPRIKANFLLSDRWLLKGGFGVNSQFVHLLSNSSVGLPTDIWVPSTANTGFQKSWQVVMGTQFKLWKGIQLEVETYYRNMNRLLTLAEGLQADENWEKDVTVGSGRAWGAEFLIRLNQRRFNGWFGYHLGWSDRTFERVNFGDRFPFRYDRRHSFDLVLSYRLTNNLSISGKWELFSGLAFNFPSEQFEFQYPGIRDIPITATDFGQKNEFRMPWYHRLDLGMDYRFISFKRTTHHLHVGVYNLYNQQNPFFFRLQSRIQVDQGDLVERKEVEQVSLLPFLPSLSYRVRF